MSIDLSKKLGQLFFVGFQGYTLSKQTKEFLQNIQPGGIIFFECNIKDKKQVKRLITEVNNCLAIKPFIAVDQEGGSVERLRNICTSVPSIWGLSKVGLKELLAGQEIIANELLELGFNMVLGPVLDINSNPNNPIIGTRSISNNPTVVSKYGLAIVKMFLKYNLIPVIKHFPGHGDLNIDSHLGLPVLSKSIEKINDFELVPFKNAIKHKAPAIMTGHIQVQCLEKDNKLPASLSKNILQKLLRNKLNFKGLIITDELNMKGITSNYSLEDGALKALIAGSNMVLFNLNEKSTTKAFHYIHKNLDHNKTLKNNIEDSYKRIKAVKNKFLTELTHKPVLRNNFRISNELANKVVHWIKKDFFFKPLHTNDSIEIIFPITSKLQKSDLVRITQKLNLKRSHLIEYDLNPSTENINSILKKLKNQSKKILITYDISVRPKQKSLVKELFFLYSELPVISAGLEYDVELIPQIKNFVAAYAPNYTSLLHAFKALM